MIRTGQTIENPATGERLTFRQTSRDTGGEYVVVETALQPGATVAAAHVHPYQTERFEVVEGTVGLQVGREQVEAGPGEVVTVEPGVAHRF
jgi:quercetin dioxygenase-like cupin family protein